MWHKPAIPISISRPFRRARGTSQGGKRQCGHTAQGGLPPPWAFPVGEWLRDGHAPFQGAAEKQKHPQEIVGEIINIGPDIGHVNGSTKGAALWCSMLYLIQQTYRYNKHTTKESSHREGILQKPESPPKTTSIVMHGVPPKLAIGYSLPHRVLGQDSLGSPRAENTVSPT